ncbi:hypothetical protein [Fontivita pretiosa]|uniref:hypothetical protein n=1 Tax=Fontivita pretiosa TaxID=2989684 RepID=UPI003D16AE6F
MKIAVATVVKALCIMSASLAGSARAGSPQASAPGSAATTAPAAPAPDDTAVSLAAAEQAYRQALNNEQAARTHLHTVRDDCLRRFQATQEFAELHQHIEQLEHALHLARQKAQPQQRLDASSAYNQARLKLDQRRRQFMQVDPALVQAQQTLWQAQQQTQAALAQVQAERALAAAAERIRQLQLYAACVQADDDQLELKQIPLLGDETPIAAVVADPWKYVGRVFIVCGAVEVSDWFDGTYQDAKPTHLAFSFQQLDRAASPGNRALLYVRRGVGDELAAACARATLLRSGATRVIRARVTIPPQRASLAHARGDMLEVLDWQYLAPGGGQWSLWASQVQQPPPAARHRPADPTQPQLAQARNAAPPAPPR